MVNVATLNFGKGFLLTVLYSISYKLLGDTTELTVYSPYNFKRDFKTNFQFDTSKYYEFRFLKLKDTVVKIVSVTKQAQEITINSSISSKLLFLTQILSRIFKFDKHKR